MAAIAGLLAAGVIVDLPERPVSERPVRYVSALAAPAGIVSTWFCPGGSGPDGAAELTVQLVSGSDQRRTAAVAVLPGGSDPDDAGTMDIEIEPRGRVLLRPSEEVPGAQWVGAVVEVDGPDVVVEQILTTKQGGVGRSPCLTRTADRWVVPNGATRSRGGGRALHRDAPEPVPGRSGGRHRTGGRRGRDSIEGLVIPAQRVVAVDVTEEITVAATVAAFVDVVSGRVAASWIQISDGPIAGTGVRLPQQCPTPPPVVSAGGRGGRGAARCGGGLQPVGGPGRRSGPRDHRGGAGHRCQPDRDNRAAGTHCPRRPLRAGSP